MLGPVSFNADMTSNIDSSEILHDFVSGLVGDLPLSEKLSAWYLRDGAPPHSAHHAVQFLDRLFGDKWVGCFGAMAQQVTGLHSDGLLFVSPH